MNEEGEKQDNSKGLVRNIFNKFYEFWSQSKIKFYFRLIYGILAIHLSIYAIGLARYEFKVFSLYTKMSNLVTLSEGKNPGPALERIAYFSRQRIPIEPKVYDIWSGIKSLFPQFDDSNSESSKELIYLIVHNKSDLNHLNLGESNFSGGIESEESIKFTHSSLQNVNFANAILKENFFQYSIFYNVDFHKAEMSHADFSFSKFDYCNLIDADLTSSNFCEAKFIRTPLMNANLSNANLMGVNLSEVLSYQKEFLPKLQGAYYNSQVFTYRPLKISDKFFHKNKEKTKVFSLFLNCISREFITPPTKFPSGFDPEAHGMIDISKW